MRGRPPTGQAGRITQRRSAKIQPIQRPPDFACPPGLKRAACAAIEADINQYAITWGARDFRGAIAAKTARHHPGWRVDSETDVTVTCGATEGMIAAMLAVLDPGDEVVVFEPFYENYRPDAILSVAVPRYVTLHEPDWSIDEAELRAAFGSRTRGVVVNSPHNPTGKVFRGDELELIAELCREHDVVAFTDDIYEHIVYAGQHVPARHPARHGRAHGDHQLAVEDVLGHRPAWVGWMIAPPHLTAGIRKVHDFLTVGAAAAPLQAAGTSPSACPTTTTGSWPPATASAATCSWRRSRRPASAPFRRTAPTTSWPTSAR